MQNKVKIKLNSGREKWCNDDSWRILRLWRASYMRAIAAVKTYAFATGKKREEDKWEIEERGGDEERKWGGGGVRVRGRILRLWRASSMRAATAAVKTDALV